MNRQRTIGSPARIEGVGLQTGAGARVTLKAAPAGSGISFVRSDLPGSPALSLKSGDIEAAAGERRTTLGLGPFQIQTTEHLLAAIAGLSIDNVVIEIDGAELPGLDGSARGYVDAIRKAGIKEQDAPRDVLVPDGPVWCRDRDSLVVMLPDENFRISYTMSYPAIGTQFFSTAVDEAVFERDIAPARTFCLESEALELLKRGLGKGANYDNTLVMGAAGPVNNTLRFPDEPVRHKVLDLIGDLCLAGPAIRGHVVAVKSGHRLNMELVRKLKETPRWEAKRST